MTTSAAPTELLDSIEDPVLTAVLANRFDGIVREMSNTLLRAARSTVIAAAKDFSCAILTADDQLITAADGLPVHIFGASLQTRSMRNLHDDIAEGDAFLHNDPYLGSSHAADHALLAPVFIDGEHLFTACAKAHQADIGNSVPTTYHAFACDIYEEGALIFPCVRVQKNYEINEDIVRMCRRRIRVPEQWYGDFLALIGAVRIGERRLKALCAKSGTETVTRFVGRWMDYSEARMASAIRALPSASLVSESTHDPVEDILPDGIPVKAELTINSAAAMIEVDLRDNVDFVDCGLNQTEASYLANVFTAVLNCLADDVPHNSGAFRCVRVVLRDDCVVGRPVFPHSCSACTTNVAERLIYAVQGAFAKLGEGYRLADGSSTMGAAMAVISGQDPRRGGDPYVGQLFLGLGGGPAGPMADGWLTYCMPTAAGMIRLDSVELDEARYPTEIHSIRVLPATLGAGQHCGAPVTEVIYGPATSPLTAVIPSDGHYFPPRGAHGGADGHPGGTYKRSADGTEVKLANFVQVEIPLGEALRSIEGGGAGYGDPRTRDPAHVLRDISRGRETQARAAAIYSVVITGSRDKDTLALDAEATDDLRAEIMES
jgi:N-methylhydantoinase B